MKEFLDLYNIEIDENIKIEALYIKKEDFNTVDIFLQNIDSKEKIAFNIVDTLYGKDSNISGYKILLEMPINNGKYEIVVKTKKKIYNLEWSNNQNIKMNFNENKYIMFSKNKEITLLNNGLYIKSKKLFSKINYNLKKIMYGIKEYKRLFLFRFLKFKSKYILINDRVIEGNDNGEALFKYIRANNDSLKKNTYYVINKNSDKYKELKNLGHVLKFGSLKHKFLFLNSKVIGTSYIGNSKGVYNPFNEQEMNIYSDLINKRVIFLQHGIMMTDFHLMFNRARMVIDKFVVSTKKEAEDINNQGYLYSKDMIIRTGLPRYDLLKNNNQRKILISFTWRKWLKDLNEDDFIKSQYYLKLESLLKNKEFKHMINKYNYKIELVLHSELNSFYNCFIKFNDNNVKVYKSSDIVYSNIFSSSDLLLTDYSSIHYDVAYLKKPVLYYQYDLHEFLTNHTNNGKGNFDYIEDGFGEIIDNEKQLISKLEHYLKNECKMKPFYLKRVKNNFIYNDANNSKRVCEHIIELLDKKEIPYRFNSVQ